MTAHRPSLQTLLQELPERDPFASLEAFQNWNESQRGLTLYPAQEEALSALALGANVILATPTGTGKSLVAAGAHLIALNAGERTVYTAPIKALVSEKFFDLVELFGAENVGMVTGETSLNPGAPILCCTAEILANLALRDPEVGNIRQVVMDEFHYYADPDRGWAWQVPLLLMPKAQFLLMSATLGDVTQIAGDLTRDTGRETELVTGVERPVLLAYTYVKTAVHETVEHIIENNKTPAYIVHFNQLAAVEAAQALSSIRVASREHRDEIAQALDGFRFAKGFGQTLSRYIRAGIGVHHAGMLPKYRRLVEQLAQRGLLKIISGTDTLGVGINVPIRSVLFTALSKFDGEKMRRLTAREFHQIAGRAGRAGYDSAGDVFVEAPEHEIENAKAEEKAAAKKKKVVKKKPPAGFVSWTDKAMEQLIQAEPEPLVSRMVMTHSMVLSVLSRPGAKAADCVATMRQILFQNHEPRARQFELARRAIDIYRTLKTSGLVGVTERDGEAVFELTVDLPENFALNQPLSPFAVAAFELLDPDSDSFALDVISIVEATLENPRAILRAQEKRARGEAVAAMKAEGIEYDERMELLEEVSYPKPLDELLQAAYDEYVQEVPWARDFAIEPKSVVRDMVERAANFRDYVNLYDLGRVEGVVLRYLSDAYKALEHTVPVAHRNEDFESTVAWLGETVRQVDSSLLEEWEELSHPNRVEALAQAHRDPEDLHELAAPPNQLSQRTKAFRIMVRNAVFQRVQAAAHENYQRLAELDAEHGFSRRQWEQALDNYFSEYDQIGTGASARAAALFQLDTDSDSRWEFTQTLEDPHDDRDWHIRGFVDLGESDQQGEPVVVVEYVGPHGSADPGGAVG